MNEAAACRTLNLVEEDHWNIAEKFYEPQKHFVYYNKENLSDKSLEIQDNWREYKVVAEAAHEHFINNYTTEKLYNRIKNNENDSNWI